MKKAKKDSNSFIPTFYNFRSFLKKNSSNVKHEETDYYLKLYEGFISFATILPGCVYILDKQTGKYLFISNHATKLFGYNPIEIKASGQRFMFKQFHPDDVQILNKKQHILYLGFLYATPVEELKKFRFSLNFRFKRKDNKYIHILQQYLILECDRKGNPLLEMGICTDISAHKMDNTIALGINKFDQKKGFTNISSKLFSNTDLLISKKEHEVLKQVAKGYENKIIALNLKISEYTVRAHRRSLLRKTGSKNSAALTHFAISNGLVVIKE
jgi:DNA-binding CsgD family transcriptional regulator